MTNMIRFYSELFWIGLTGITSALLVSAWIQMRKMVQLQQHLVKTWKRQKGATESRKGEGALENGPRRIARKHVAIVKYKWLIIARNIVLQLDYVRCFYLVKVFWANKAIWLSNFFTSFLFILCYLGFMLACPTVQAYFTWFFSPFLATAGMLMWHFREWRRRERDV